MERVRPTSRRFRATWRSVALALIAPACVTLLAVADRHPPTTIIATLFVLAVVIAARMGGATAGVIAAIVSFLSLNFFFTPPLHTFAVSASSDLVALSVFLAIALLVGLLLSSAVEARERAELRELEVRLVNRLATRLLSGEQVALVLTGFADDVCEAFHLARCEITTSLTDPVAAGEPRPPGTPTDIPLRGGDPIGALRIWTARGDPVGDDRADALDATATQLALALEAVRLNEAVRVAELEAEASRVKAALFSGVTHDVKTPLAAIMASVTSLQDGGSFSEEDRRAHLDSIRHEAERLHRVVNNLLDVARMHAGALQPAKIPSAMDELMESVVSRLRPMLEGRAIDMRVADDLPEVPMDVVQMDQVLTNLLENAAKFSPPGSTISLSVVGAPDSIRVTVADRGAGISRDDRDRIFDPFERGDHPVPGTGLGLAISRAIVEAHGGRIWATNDPLGGASFTFELPCGSAPEPKERADARARAGR